MRQNNRPDESTAVGDSVEKINMAGRMAQAFLENRHLTMLTILIILVWGLGSFFIMPKAYNPEIVAPAFVITTDFSGATADQVQSYVTRPLENAVSELPHIDHIVSNSIDGGRSIVTVQFVVGTATESAKVSLVQKLRDNMHQKPAGVTEPSVVTLDPDDVPIMSIALTSQSRSPEALRVLAWNLADTLKHIDGTAKISVIGGRTEHLQVELDAAKLAATRISVSDVIGAIRSASGTYAVEALKDTEGTETVRIDGGIASIEDAKNLVVVPDQNQPVTLGDIATITVGPGEIIESVRVTGHDRVRKDTAYVTIAKQKDTNISSVTAAIRNELESQKRRPEFSSVDFSILRDDGATAHEEITTLTHHLILSVLIVVLILMAFLGLRNALIVAITIPLTLLASFGVGLLVEQTVNRITLFALILALGLLVDDAIVIIENIHRTLKAHPGGSRARLIVDAVSEVGMGVFMSTVTILLAFIPMAFVTGMMGPYMEPIPFFVSVTLLVSLLLAFTINPALIAFFTPVKHVEKPDNIFVRSIHRLENGYARLIDLLVRDTRKKNLILGGAAILLILSFLLPAFRFVQFRMLPKADREQFSIYLDLPSGTSASRTENVAAALENAALADPTVVSVEGFVGTAPITDFNGLFKGSFARSREYQATIKVNLLPKDERDVTSERIVLRMREAITAAALSLEPDARVTLVEDPPGPPVRSTFLLKIQSDQSDLREAATRDAARLAAQIPGIVDLQDSIQTRGLERHYRVDTDKAGRLGIDSATLVSALHAGMSGAQIGRYDRITANDASTYEQHLVVVRMRPEDRAGSDALNRISVRSTSGDMIPVSELLTSETLPDESMISSDDRSRTLYVSGEMGDRSVMYAVLDLFPRLLDYRLPDGTGRIVNWSPLGITYENGEGERLTIRIDGEWKLTLDIFRDLGIAMGVAILFIYFILVIQLRSLLTPVLIMATIPLALIGVLGGFAVLAITRGIYFNATSMIGVIALAGIVVKNAIIYLAYLDELRLRGLGLTEALREAGRVRLLPILLTSLTAILGSLTIIADPVWEGLAWAIIFGLSSSTVLTLVIFPLLYQTFEGKKWKNKE